MASNETLDPLAPVALPASAPLTLNVLPVAADDDARWLQGFQWRPEGCANNGGVLAPDCFGKTSAMNTSNVEAIQKGTGFLVWVRDQCSTFGYEASDYEGRARRLLASVEDYYFTAELSEAVATGPTSGIAFDTNLPLVNNTATVVGGAALTIDKAVACLDNALAVNTKNRQGFIFMRPQMLTLAAGLFVIQRINNQWVTPLGNLVIADAGISGKNPSGGAITTSQFMFARSWTQVRRGAVTVFGGPNATGIDRTANTVFTYAVRPYMWQWDGCYQAAVEVSVAECN